MQYPIDEVIYPNRNNYGTNNINSNNDYINTEKFKEKINRLIHKEATKQTRKNIKTGAIHNNNYNRQYETYSTYYKNKPKELRNYSVIKHKEAERGREKVRKATIKAQLRYNRRRARKIRRETKNNETRKIMNDYLEITKKYLYGF